MVLSPIDDRLVTRDCESNLKRPLSKDSVSDEDIKLRKTETRSNNNDIVQLKAARFLVIRHKEEGKTLRKVSPFLINKAIVGASGEPASIKKLRDGSVLVEAASEKQSKHLLKMMSLYDSIPVTVSPHGTLNSSKGIVFSRELLECDVVEVKSELRSCFVTDVVRLMRTENGKQIPTAGHILTFSLPHPPESIKAGYLSLPVRPYYRNPQRCFKCQKYGHSSGTCPNEERCVQCGSNDHNDKSCEMSPMCVNCQGKHSAASRSCKTYLEEKAIIKITTDNKISFGEARIEHRRQTQLPRHQVSFAQAAAITPQPANSSCSNCASLEATVRSLSDLVASLVRLLSQSTLLSGEACSQPPPKQIRPVHTEMKLNPQSRPDTAKATKNTKSIEGSKLVRPGMSQEERQSLADSFKKTVASKVANRTKGNIKPNPSNRSSQVQYSGRGHDGGRRPTVTVIFPNNDRKVYFSQRKIKE